MEYKVYSVNIGSNNYYYVIALSKEHAVIEVVSFIKNLGQKDNPTDYDISDVKELTNEEIEDLIIDYNYITKSYEKISMKEFFEEALQQVEDVYGVVCDDFIIHNGSFDKTLIEYTDN